MNPEDALKMKNSLDWPVEVEQRLENLRSRIIELERNLASPYELIDSKLYFELIEELRATANDMENKGEI